MHVALTGSNFDCCSLIENFSFDENAHVHDGNSAKVDKVEDRKKGKQPQILLMVLRFDNTKRNIAMAI